MQLETCSWTEAVHVLEGLISGVVCSPWRTHAAAVMTVCNPNLPYC